MLPKFTLVGFAVNSADAATPEPLREIDIGEFGALLVSATLPVTLPTDAGANAASKVALLPGAIVSGTVSPLMLNPAPETAACVIVRLAVPGLLSRIVCVLVLPVATLPKLTLEGVAEICG